jgi:hypothetical protein
MILVCSPYSLPFDVSICNGLRTYVAIPPLVPFSRRCSTTVYPSIMGAAAPFAIHVSCIHSISIFYYSRRSSNLI